MMHNPSHPGAILKQELANISIAKLAKHLGVSRTTLSRILNSRAGITPQMSLKLSDAFNMSPDSWFKMQANYDFWMARKRKRRKIPRLKTASKL